MIIMPICIQFYNDGILRERGDIYIYIYIYVYIYIYGTVAIGLQDGYNANVHSVHLVGFMQERGLIYIRIVWLQ